MRGRGTSSIDVVVVDSGSTDDTVDLVRREFPDVRVLTTENRGFAAANNRGLEVVDAEWVLFLNPDTRILSGTLEELVSLLRARPTVGLAGVKQIDENGVMDPTMRRFPRCRPVALREPRRGTTSSFAPHGLESVCWTEHCMTAKPLATGQSARSCSHARQRSMTSAAWTSASFSIARRPTSAFGYDRRAGSVVHLPQMTIFHQSSRTASDDTESQMAFARRQYMAKHFAPAHRARGHSCARPRVRDPLRLARSRPERPPPTSFARSALATARRARAAPVPLAVVRSRGSTPATGGTARRRTPPFPSVACQHSARARAVVAHRPLDEIAGDVPPQPEYSVE